MSKETPEARRLSYCQYLLSSQVNFTLTNYAEHAEAISHDTINRHLSLDTLTPAVIWKNIRGQVIPCPIGGCILFDDTVADKNFSNKIEMVRRQYSGNAHGIIKGIGIVTCVYLNTQINQWWVINYRVFDPDNDGKSKHDHVKDMLRDLVQNKTELKFDTVLMDSWYGTRDAMLLIQDLGKTFYCPLKKNRLASDAANQDKAPIRLENLNWDEEEEVQGKRGVRLNKFPKDRLVNLFRIIASDGKVEFVATNNASPQLSAKDVKAVCALRWKIEQFHRELKQLTGLEKCQCRKRRIQRNHIASAMLVWIRLNQAARAVGSTVYQVKQGLLREYLRRELREPAVPMTLA